MNQSIELVVGKILKEKKLSLSLAESCTGGLIANKITNIPGSSTYFKGGIVSYTNETKQNLLQISQKILIENGAVSKEVVIKMAEQVRDQINTDIALATSGILGPDGATDQNPIGTLWIAIADKNKTQARLFYLNHNNRLQNKTSAANIALQWLKQWIE